jgi:putative heme-binding domain-containing protein
MKFLPFLLLLAAAAPAAERIPWTTSHVQGSPEPPKPYRVERAFPQLSFATPVETSTIPGTQRVAVLEIKGRLFSFPDDESIAQPELMGDLTKFDPEVVEAYGFTFHPQFAENRFVYVWINLDMKRQKSRPNGSRIVRFRVTEGAVPRLDLTTGKVMYEWMYGGHNGGNVRFGPDGMLYLGTGDGGFAHPADERGSGQDITSVLSKILRIDVDHASGTKPFSIPKDNPFVSTPAARGEIWAYGVRNPWRLSFDAKTGALWVGDVGWELWESVIRVERGGNYGWSITEASKQAVWPDRPRGPTPILPPTWAHSHEESVSITGGEVYYGKKLPELDGAYVYADWQFGTFWALREGSAPVEICRSNLMPVGFGVGPDGEPLICDYGGSGGLFRLARNPAATNPVRFPTRLSETGLFSDVVKQTPAPGVEPFAINAPRWADHAKGERWAGFPGASGITVAAKALGVLPAGRCVFPEGSVLAKTYSIEMEAGNPQTRRALETQLLHYDGAQWAAYSYRWNDGQTDAELVPARGAEQTLEIKDAHAPGGTRQQTWRYFARIECLRCHNLQANTVAGFTPPQLDRPVPAAEGGQLERFAKLGLAPLEEPRFADPFGDRGSLEIRARSYLHANCSGCHRTHGGGSVPSVMDIETPLKSAMLLSAKPVQGDLGLTEGRVIAPGRPSRSVLLYRMATAGRGHMPYLGARLVHDQGVLLIRDWIAGLPPDKDAPPAARAAEEAEYTGLATLSTGDATPLTALLGTSSGALSVALAVLDGTLWGDVRQQAIAQGSALADPLRRDLFERFLPESQRRRVLGPDIHPEALLALRGDAARGQTLFATLCNACHRVGQVGTDFGPDLSHIAAKYQPPALLDQILAPSKIVEPAWQLATLTLTGGEVRSGFITARDENELTLRVAGGATQKLSTKLVMKTELARTSIMPEGMLQSFTAQEAADLLAFLAAQK